MSYKTEQEAFWAGEFGEQYSERNRGDQLLASNLAFFAAALAKARSAASCIEFGANIGMNLRALRLLYPGQQQHAVEINPKAARQLAEVIPEQNIYQASMLDFSPDQTWDLVLVKGVLIHLNPNSLPRAYDVLHQATGRYLLVCEYYSPTPVVITYRGHSERLFKRDFCGEILDRFSNLDLIDYGFRYRRDPNFPQDDINWFLMEKRR
jgi:pseudaminic acid biosynthesis-associated methylase